MSAPGTEAPSERLALVSLALASLPNSKEVQAAFEASYPEFRALPVSVALDVLAATLASPSSRMPRLVVLDALVRLAARTRKLEHTPHDSPLDRSLGRLAGAIAATAAHIDLSRLEAPSRAELRAAQSQPQPESHASSLPAQGLAGVGARVAQVFHRRPTVLERIGSGFSRGPDQPVTIIRDALIQVSNVQDLHFAWEQFATQTAEVLHLSAGEKNKPLCDCSQVINVGGYDAQVVKVDFETEVPLDKMRNYADPRNWPDCSTYFSKMMEYPKGNRKTVSGTKDWLESFEEVINVLPGLTLINPLRFTYTEDDHHVCSKYELVEPTEHILVDQGYISVTDETPTKRTAVEVVKVIRFSDPAVQSWPSFACDLFWGELSIDMAMQCANGQ